MNWWWRRGGMYVVKQMWSYDPVTRKTSFSRSAFASYVWVTAIVAWNNILGIYLLYASFRCAHRKYM